jgi:hypothetical protein
MRTYERADYKTLAHWCARRDIEAPPEWVFPATGYIVDEIAAGFLVFMNNEMAMIDFFISNPLSDKKERDKALDKISKALIARAKDAGIKMLICTTQKEAVKKRALFHDFKYQGEFSAFRLELK